MQSTKNIINYTIINHEAQERLGLSPNEYCLLDKIAKLSKDPERNYWCDASKQTLAKMIKVSKQTVHVSIKKLVSRKYLEKHPITKHLRVCLDWEMEVSVNNSKESLPVKKVYSDSKESLADDSKDTLPNNNMDNNDSNKDMTDGPTIVPQEAVRASGFDSFTKEPAKPTGRNEAIAYMKDNKKSDSYTSPGASSATDEIKHMLDELWKYKPELRARFNEETGRIEKYSKTNNAYEVINNPRKYLDQIKSTSRNTVSKLSNAELRDLYMLIKDRRPDLRIKYNHETGKLEIYSKQNKEWRAIHNPRAYLNAITTEDAQDEERAEKIANGEDFSVPTEEDTVDDTTKDMSMEFKRILQQ